MRSAALAMCSQSAPRAALTVAILSFLCALDLLAWCCRKLLALREAIGAAEATKADVEVLCALPITLPRSCGMLDATVSTATRRGDDSRSHRLLQLRMGWARVGCDGPVSHCSVQGGLHEELRALYVRNQRLSPLQLPLELCRA